MTKLFIANVSNQIQQVRYRLPESTKNIMFDIGIGQQKMAAGGVGGDLDKYQLEAIIEQLSVYGFYNIDNIGSPIGVVRLVYSLDRSIVWTRLEAVRGRNFKFLNEQGAELRKQAAVAANSALNLDGQQGPKTLEMSVVEDKSGDLGGADHNPVTETVVTGNDMEEVEARTKGKPRGRA